MDMTSFRKYNLVAGWLAFAVAAVVYLLTIEPTVSLWDCGEFIATSYKLEVGHPPGAPLFMMIARLFAMLGGPTHAAMMINAMSGLCSAFTILFLFWTISHLGRRLLRVQEEEMNPFQTWAVLGAALIGSLAYTFTDTFWFSAVEGEVYAMSSLFTAAVFWAMLRWENVADEPHSTRWLILIAYLMGLSIGVHILNLLCIPALVLIYYFRKSTRTTLWGVVKALLVSGAILLVINGMIIPWTTHIGAWVDRMFNSIGAPINLGFGIYTGLLFAAVIFAIWLTHKRGKVIANTIWLCFGVILLGYASYASVVIRASANPPMNSNNPSNPYGLYSLLSRDQYGTKPLLTGPYYSSPAIDNLYKDSYYVDTHGRYQPTQDLIGAQYAPSFDDYLFPRMWDKGSEEGYKRWVDIRGHKQRYGDQVITVPTFGENLKYFFSLQLNFMFVRYFMWNFVGRQSDVQSTGQITDGQWLSGIDFIDEIRLGPQSNLPDELRDNRGRNTYYFLPFILGMLGLLYHLNRDPKNFSVVALLFFLTGVALVIYLNGKPVEPRERDYVYAGAFYAYCIWVGLGAMWLSEALARLFKRQTAQAAILATALCSCVPLILATQNWDDHDRSRRYAARDIGYNYLNATLPNSILVTYGDNDAFPLWYNQEVEGVRTDVRIMNMMYLSADWYVDQMRVRSNESDPVPFSLPREKYVGGKELVLVLELPQLQGKAITLRQAIDFVADDDPRSQRELVGGRIIDFIPARTLLLPVNKANAIAAGIVKPEDAERMVDTIPITLTGDQLGRNDLMFLDMLATFDWSRPIYFSQPNDVAKLGLREYLQFDGFGYRFVPIATPSTMTTTGRIDVEYLHRNLMEVFRYGNVKDPHVYVDYFIDYNFGVAQVRNAFAQLAQGLVAQGENERAIAALDRCMEELPLNQFRRDYLMNIPVIEAYYAAGAIDKGDALFNDYVSSEIQYVNYYLQFVGTRHPEVVAAELQEPQTKQPTGHLLMLGSLYNIARANERVEIGNRIAMAYNQAQEVLNK